MGVRTYMNVNEILARRTDLSTFLVHLTRADTEELTAEDSLASILRSQVIEARNPFGMAADKLRSAGDDASSQNTVCFTETPLENVNLLASAIEGRACQFAPYGIAITRRQARSLGVNPVWYLDITPGHNWLTNPINTLVQTNIENPGGDSRGILEISPFMEQMGTRQQTGDGPGEQGYRKEFWWEREWRHVGNFSLPPRYIVLCPKRSIPALRGIIEELDEFAAPNKYSFVDPMWSLEMIIGKLAGFSGSELGAF